MNISPEEAARSLQEIEASRAAMRRAIHSHMGHLYLWLWGTIWIAMSVLSWRYEIGALHAIWWLAGGGTVATFVVAMLQSCQIRTTIDRRFLGVCAILLVFGYLVWPFLLGDLHSISFRSYKGVYAYFTVIWMQIYMVAGIWFDNFWFWIGLSVSACLIAALIFAPAVFWAVPLLFGFVLVGSGFYIRFCWR